MKRIIVIGAGISGLTAAEALQRKGHDVLVLDEGDRAGGVIGTHAEAGFLFENGPNSFLDNAPDTLALCNELGLEHECLRTSMRDNARFIYLNGELHEVPTGPGGLYGTRILSAKSKRRLMAEPLRGANREKEDESLAAFVRRRLGDEVLDHLVTPFVSGVYAGDPEHLSLRATFPVLYDLEREWGSLIGGSIKKKLFGAKSTQPAKPRARNLCSFVGGMQTLTDTLAKRLGEKIWICNRVTGIERYDDKLCVHALGIGNHTQEADAVLVTIPAYATADLLSEYIPRSYDYLQSIPYNHVVVAGLGYAKEQVGHACDGFGYLVPRGQGVRILGSIWSSSLFARRAPGSHHAFSVFLGGSLDPEIAHCSDDEIYAIAQKDLYTTVGAEGDPVYRRLVRWPRAIPQYPVGHVDRVQTLRDEIQSVQGLYLCGNYMDGVSVNDCIRNARAAAETIHAGDWPTGLSGAGYED